jgi:hypothetical protein
MSVSHIAIFWGIHAAQRFNPYPMANPACLVRYFTDVIAVGGNALIRRSPHASIAVYRETDVPWSFLLHYSTRTSAS